VYVSAWGNVTVVDGNTRTVTKKLPPNDAFDVALDPEGATLYTHSESTPGTVAVVDTRTGNVLRMITTTYLPMGMAVDPATRTLYLANAEPAPGYFNAGTSKGIVLTTINADTPQTFEIPLGRPEIATGIAVDPHNHDLYITTESDHVDVVDPGGRKGLATATVGRYPRGPALDTQRRILYTANLLDDTVSVVDYNT
jgi:DNA-binding beta-propeller fold protein YncE